MNISTHTRRSIRFWTPVSVAGAAAAGAIAATFVGVAAGPASSAPPRHQPVVSSVVDGRGTGAGR